MFRKTQSTVQLNVADSSIIITAIERQSVIAELDDIWRQVVESPRPVCAQLLGGADHHVAVMKSFLVPVNSEEASTRSGVGEYGVLTTCRRVVDVPLLPERSLAAGLTLTDEPVCRQDAVN